MNYINKMSSIIKNTVGHFDSNDIDNLDKILDKCVELICYKKKNNNRVIFVGNGGSAAIAIHMTADYFKNGGVRTVSMYDPAILTCLGNDFGYEYVFSKQIEKHIESGDLLVTISSSGNSKNIVNAIEMAHEKRAKVMSLTGFSEDNICRKLADYSIYVPSSEYGIVESVHNCILQEIVDRMISNE